MANTELSHPGLFDGKHVAVIGASGFIGSHVVQALLDSGCVVHAFSRSFPGLISDASISHPNYSSQYLTLSDPELVRNSLQRIDIVVHLACSTLPKQSNEMPYKDVTDNVLGTLNLLDACIANNVSKFVFISSGGTVYGLPSSVPICENHPTDPICSYGISKLAIEKYISLYTQLYGLQSVVFGWKSIRSSSAFKVESGVIPVFWIKH